MNNTSMQQQTHLNISKAFSQQQLIHDLDPMLEGGQYKVVFNRECPLQIRQTDTQGKEFGIRNMLNVRIMASPQSSQSYQQVKIQLTSQSDLYFVFECKLSDKKFDRLRKAQALNYPFQNLIPMLIKLLNLCDKFPQQYSTIFYMSKVGTHRLIIIQNIQYKSIELISLQFQSVDNEVKKQCISFRFSLLKARNQRIENKTKQMLGMVKLKNPNLLQSLAKKNNTNMNMMIGTTMMLSRMNRTTTNTR